MVPFVCLPPEVILLITQNLGYGERAALAKTSKKFATIIRSSWSQMRQLSHDDLTRFPGIRDNLDKLSGLDTVDASIFICGNVPQECVVEYREYVIQSLPGIKSFTNVSVETIHSVHHYCQMYPFQVESIELVDSTIGELCDCIIDVTANGKFFKCKLKSLTIRSLYSSLVYTLLSRSHHPEYLRHLDVQFLSQNDLDKLCILCPYLHSLVERNFEDEQVPPSHVISWLEQEDHTAAGHILKLKPLMCLSQLRTLRLTSLVLPSTITDLLNLMDSPHSKLLRNISLNLTIENPGEVVKVLLAIGKNCTNLRLLQLSFDTRWFHDYPVTLVFLKMLKQMYLYDKVTIKRIYRSKVVQVYVI